MRSGDREPDPVTRLVSRARQAVIRRLAAVTA